MTTTKRVIWGSLVALACLIALIVPIYNQIEPSIAGIPFFYWFQFIWIIVTAVITALAYKAGL